MAKPRKPTPGEILEQAHRRLKEQNPLFSMRAAAKKLKVSAPFLLKVLKNQTPIPEKRFSAFAQVFQLDDIAQERLREAMLLGLIDKKSGPRGALQTLLREKPALKEEAEEEFHLYPEKQYELLRHWYYFAILDLSTCAGFQSDAGWIAKTLGLGEREAKEAIVFLLKNGFLIEQNGELKKTHKNIRLATKRSMQIVRDYHAQLITRGIQYMKTNVTEADFNERLIAGVTFALDPIHFDEAKSILNKALYEISGLADRGNCTRVYQISGLLFPLSKRKVD